MIELLFKITSDECLFYFLQISLVLTFLIALANESIAQYKSGKGSVTLSVERGDESMAKFYGAYIAINSLLVAICLSVDVIQNYKIFWVFFDTVIPAYLCIFNPWSRNKLLSWSHMLTKLEAR